MGTSKAYDDLVEGFRKKISGNVESKVMTPEQTQAEIAEVTGGAFYADGPHMLPEVIAPKRRGRPKGSKNRPKEVK